MNQESGFAGIIENPAFAVPQNINFENLCDFRSVEQGGTRLTSGIKEIRIKKVNEFKENVKIIRRYKDLDRNIVYGIPISKNPDGTYLYKKLVVREVKVFNLANKMESYEFHVLKTAPFMEGSPFNYTGEPAAYYVHDENQLAEEKILTRKQMRTALEFLDSLSDEKIRNYGRVFEIDPATNTIAVIRNMLEERAAKKPQSIISLFKDAQYTEAAVVFERCKATGLIHEELTGIKTKQGLVLGMTKLSAIQMLSTNLPVMQMLNEESKRVEAIGFKLTKKVEVSKTLEDSYKNQQKNNPAIDDFINQHGAEFAKKQKVEDAQVESFKAVIPTKEELSEDEALLAIQNQTLKVNDDLDESSNKNSAEEKLIDQIYNSVKKEQNPFDKRKKPARS